MHCLITCFKSNLIQFHVTCFRYILYDDAWRAGSACTLAGIISTVSSESSVLLMSFITLDRILVIKYPFGQMKFNQKNGLIAALACWVLSLMLAIAPVMFTGYFEENFYSRSRVCLALPLTRDRPAGWQYSLTVFVGFNFVTFILIAFGQCLLYSEIKKQAGKMKRETSRRRDLVVARNLLFVVATDFLCWFPIGCMGNRIHIICALYDFVFCLLYSCGYYYCVC